jgi:hypothetical protein
MEKQSIKDLLYGGINELIHNNKLYRYTPIGQDYCRFTSEGELALKEFLQQMAVIIYTSEESDLDKRSKDRVIKELKGEVL